MPHSSLLFRLSALVCALLLATGCLAPNGPEQKDGGVAFQDEGGAPVGPRGNGGGYDGGRMVVGELAFQEGSPEEYTVALNAPLKLSPGLGYAANEPAALFDPLGENFTLAFVIEAHDQLDVRTATNSVVEKWDDYQTGYPFACRFHNRTSAQAGKLACYTFQKNGNVVVALLTQGSVADGRYHSIVYQKEGSQFRLYHNGVLVASKEAVVAGVANNAIFRLGHRLASASYPFYGRLGAVRIYGQPVDGAAVAALGVSDAQRFSQPSSP